MLLIRRRLLIFAGTATNPAPNKSKGIYLLELDPATGALTSKGVAAESTSPSFLAVHPSGRFLAAFGARSVASSNVPTITS